MGISSARFVALAAHAMPWKIDAYLLSTAARCGVVATTHLHYNKDGSFQPRWCPIGPEDCEYTGIGDMPIYAGEHRS
jgi:hypothetical protein